MRTALFVDFDNVFSGLKRLGDDYAEAFARNPSRWLEWLVASLEAPAGAGENARRRILVRRCYLNPEPYKRFRIGFSRAGFEIVDCPPMTTAGKTSTDIHMVLDMIDVLQSSTRYDEFIVFSADADFTPVLRKLRREDRRTTIFAAGATSASYDASADLIIDPEDFIGKGLGFDDQQSSPLMPNLETLTAQAEAVVWRTVDQAPQPVSLPALTKALATQVTGLVEADWAGKGTFFALLKSLPLQPLVIDRESNTILDPRRLAGDAREPRNGAQALTTPSKLPNPPLCTTQQPESTDSPDLQVIQASDVAAMLAQELSQSERPIAAARLAQLARERLPGIERNWLGNGSWKKLLDSLQGPNLQVVWTELSGIALDPSRHTLDVSSPSEGAAMSAAEIKQSADVSAWLTAAGIPVLEFTRYKALLEGVSLALSAGKTNLTDITRIARDHCVEIGKPVSRAHASTVMRALLFNGFDPEVHGRGLGELIAFTCGMVASVCSREEVRMTDDDKQTLLEWIGA